MTNDGNMKPSADGADEVVGSSRREFLAKATLGAAGAVIGVVAASIRDNPTVHIAETMRLADRPDVGAANENVVHGVASIRPSVPLSHTHASPEDGLVIALNLKDRKGQPITGLNVTGHFGTATTDANGDAMLPARMGDLVSLASLGEGTPAYMPEDRTWTLMFSTARIQNTVRIDSAFSTNRHADTPRTTTICTSGRARHDGTNMPVVACLLIS